MNDKYIQKILTCVSDETEVPEDFIKSSIRFPDVVDARCMFVYFCDKAGISRSSVAKFTDMDISRIRKLAYTFDDRYSQFKVFQIEVEKIRKRLKLIFEKNMKDAEQTNELNETKSFDID